MIEVPLTRGQIAVIDDADAELVRSHTWHAVCPKGHWYAAATDGTLMHRLLLDAPPGMAVDHRDGDGLHNRRHNLRLCAPVENNRNARRRRDNRSGYKGVSRYRGHRVRGAWVAGIRVNGRRIHLGYRDTPEEAALLYDAAARRYFGAFARMNFPASEEAAA